MPLKLSLRLRTLLKSLAIEDISCATSANLRPRSLTGSSGTSVVDSPQPACASALDCSAGSAAPGYDGSANRSVTASILSAMPLISSAVCAEKFSGDASDVNAARNFAMAAPYSAFSSSVNLLRNRRLSSRSSCKLSLASSDVPFNSRD